MYTVYYTPGILPGRWLKHDQIPPVTKKTPRQTHWKVGQKHKSEKSDMIFQWVKVFPRFFHRSNLTETSGTRLMSNVLSSYLGNPWVDASTKTSCGTWDLRCIPYTWNLIAILWMVDYQLDDEPNLCMVNGLIKHHLKLVVWSFRYIYTYTSYIKLIRSYCSDAG